GTYDKLTQKPSYDVKAFLRYEPKPLTFVAVGIEKSWGGEQGATNGPVSVGGIIFSPLPDQPLSKGGFFRGHIQFQFPLAADFAVASDIFHDFDRVGGLKNDIGAELRLTKFFIPTQPSVTTKY